MLDAEREFFETHHEELLRQFPGKFVAIKERHVFGAFDCIQEALAAGARQYGVTSLLVRRTDQAPEDACIPALTLGLLHAHPSHTTGGSGNNS